MLRAWVGVLLAGSGALMVGASSQRWGGVCSLASAVGGELTDACALRTDHDFEFLPPVDPWLPVGSSAQLAGWSLVVLAVALVLLPWALTGRRPGHVTAVALAAAGLAALAMGVATIRSGASGVVVAPVLGAVTMQVWLLLPPAVLVVLAVGARGWARASAILLVLAAPLVALFSYAVGPWDAQPWWEGMSGTLAVAAGLSLLVAAVRQHPAGEATQVESTVPSYA